MPTQEEKTAKSLAELRALSLLELRKRQFALMPLGARNAALLRQVIVEKEHELESNQTSQLIQSRAENFTLSRSMNRAAIATAVAAIISAAGTIASAYIAWETFTRNPVYHSEAIHE